MPKTAPKDDTFDTSEEAQTRAMAGSLAHDTRNDANPDVLTGAAQGRLKTIVERIERLAEDRAAVMEDMKGVYAEAKGEGFDTKILRKVIKLRQTDKVKRDEEEALIDLYVSALGGL